MIPCPSKYFFDIECLGCGYQRSFFLLLEGKFYESFVMYPPFFVVTTFVILLFYNHFSKQKEHTKLVQILGVLSLILMLISYVLKHYLGCFLGVCNP